MNTVQTVNETNNRFRDAKRPDHARTCRAVSYIVGAPGFEPGTSCSQSRRDTGLRYAPKCSRNLFTSSVSGDPQTGWICGAEHFGWLTTAREALELPFGKAASPVQSFGRSLGPEKLVT